MIVEVPMYPCFTRGSILILDLLREPSKNEHICYYPQAGSAVNHVTKFV